MNRLIILLFAVTVMAFAVPANAALNDWEAAATSDSPGFLATNIADGVYDIGVLSGDITYEFVVKSNPDETEASMCLIGRRQFGDTKVGLKYEQWPDTGTYGATVFGVADYDYGVATNPGVETHLVFVSNAGETALYVNGVYQASIAAEITLSGNVGIGYGARVRMQADRLTTLMATSLAWRSTMLPFRQIRSRHIPTRISSPPPPLSRMLPALAMSSWAFRTMG